MPRTPILLLLLATCAAIVVAIARIDVGGDDGAALAADADRAQENAGAQRARPAADLFADAVRERETSRAPSLALAFRGRVFNVEGHAVSGVPVEVGVDDGERFTVLATAFSDPKGRYSSKTSVSHDLAMNDRSRASARIARPGYAARKHCCPILDIHHEIVLSLSLAPGGVLCGSVADREGNPVDKVRIELHTDGLAGVDAAVDSVDDGTFAMTWARPGVYRLFARSAENGTATLEHIALAADEEPDPVDLVLRQSNVIAGVVEDSEQKKLGGIELWAFPAELAGRSDKELFRWRLRDESRTPLGERSVACTTDDRGAFRLKGLAPGRYYIAPALHLDMTTVGERIYTTGDDGVRIVLERYWLELRCSGGHGGRLFCSGFCSGKAGREISSSSREASDGEVVRFPVEGGREYLYGCVDAFRGFVESTVIIRWGELTTVRDIAHAQTAEPGGLRLRMLAVGASDGARSRRVSVCSLATGKDLWSWDQGAEGDAHVMAPGRYLLRVVPAPEHGWRDGAPHIIHPEPAFERQVEVPSGRVDEIELW